MKITITEALAEIKTALARIQKKREHLMNFLARDSRLKDPLADSGGSMEYVKRERQSIGDLEQRIVAIRAAIQKSNTETSLAIGDTTRTVGEWLNWRREVAPGQKAFLTAMATRLKVLRDQAIQRGQQVRDSDPQTLTATGDLVVAVSETELGAQIENMENVLGTLDGRLSLLNATTLVEVG